MVFDGEKPMQLANVEAEYVLSDNLLIWKIGPTLNLWDEGKLKTLTFFANRFVVRDSLVVFEDTRYNSVNVYYHGEIITLCKSMGDLLMPDHVGENIVAFRDNGNFYKVFWRGQIYDLDVWHSKIGFQGQMDILAFNDPINGSFAIFENGQFYDLEQFHVNEYKAGSSMVAYTDRIGNLKLYMNGKVHELSNFAPEYWDVKDNVVVWSENNAFYTFYNGEKKEIVRYIPKDFKIKNDVIAFRNLMGGVSCFVNGAITEINTQMDSEYTIHGSTVLVELFNKKFLVFQNGRKFSS